MSYVTDIPFADPALMVARCERRLSLETDCADVHAALRAGSPDFVLLHVVGSPQTWAKRHIPGAVYFPHASINAHSLERWPSDTRFVVYCAGPHCNGADRAALKLAQLGRAVKIMPGGLTGWADEGFAFAREE